MTDAPHALQPGMCPDCGRPYSLSAAIWLRNFENGLDCGVPHGWGSEQCIVYTVKRLRAQVRHLECALENYDTTDAQNHAVEEVVKKLNRIIDEWRQVGRFGGESLQRLAERILRYTK